MFNRICLTGDRVKKKEHPGETLGKYLFEGYKFKVSGIIILYL